MGMLLNVADAATVLGISARAVRARLTKGQLPGRKVEGTWRVPREALPLTDGQRAALQARADEVRAVVDAALPSRGSRRDDRRHRSVVDLAAWRAAAGLRASVCAGVAAALDEGLVALAVAFHEYRADARLCALTSARAAFARAAALSHLEGQLLAAETLEREVLPALSGLFRRAERRE